MKQFLAIVALLAYTLGAAQVKWMSLSDALEAQKTNPKKILIDFYADWCAPCREMDAQTFGHPVIANYINNQYYPVKFDAEGAESVTMFGRTFTNPEYTAGKKKNAMHEFTKFMNVNSVPSVVLLDERAAPITILNGKLTARELEPYLTLIATNSYQKIRTRTQWDDYQKKFKSSIKK